LFVPFLAVGEVSGLEEAIAESNAAEYGLTAGIFSADRHEVERFFDEIEAGVCYANKRSGATTGAWPGAQAFCGWKGSGSTGKGGCGPYYVAQFLREQNRTVIET
jgi:1-pyrroline-5-carboxylate dehydrogenase